MKPYLRYAGNKSWLKNWFAEAKISERFLTNRKLVAPFCGSLGDVFQLAPHKALLNDIYSPLVNLHNHVKYGLNIDILFQYDKDLYKSYVREFNSIVNNSPSYLANPVLSNRMAQIFYYLNRNGWHGLVRTNSRGNWNVSFGQPMPHLTEFSEYQKVMQGWDFCYGDFAQLSIKPSNQDFLMIDPPYDPISATANFTGYGSARFDWEDQVKVLKWAIASGQPFILCNHATPRIIELYQHSGLNINYFQKTRAISPKGVAVTIGTLKKMKAIEIVATNF